MSRNGTHYADIKHSSKIVYDPNDVTRFSNRYNIDFLPNGDGGENHRESQVSF